MVALTTTQGVILIGVGGALVIIAVALIASRGRAGRKAQAAPDIPSAMRPGPSDADLETPHLQKLQGWGVLLVVFFVIWIPMTWIFEPASNLSQDQAMLTNSIARGKAAVQLFTEENQGGVGCVRCHGSELKGQRIANTATGGAILAPNLTTVCGGPFTGHPLIYSTNDIYDTIERGRGQIMPSWSIKYAGALDDQQINDIVNYIVSIQDETVVTMDKNVCLNPEARKAAIDQFLDGDYSKKTPAGNVQVPT
jgi:mono/diheme cytochrome c family protein